MGMIHKAWAPFFNQ